jgi:hypothetical protein
VIVEKDNKELWILKRRLNKTEEFNIVLTHEKSTLLEKTLRERHIE